MYYHVQRKDHGHNVRAQIFCIINLDCDCVIFKIDVLPRTRTFDYAYRIYRLT